MGNKGSSTKKHNLNLKLELFDDKIILPSTLVIWDILSGKIQDFFCEKKVTLKNNTYLGGGNSNILFYVFVCSPRSLGKWSNLRSIFLSDGLKPPTRYIFQWFLLGKPVAQWCFFSDFLRIWSLRIAWPLFCTDRKLRSFELESDVDLQRWNRWSKIKSGSAWNHTLAGKYDAPLVRSKKVISNKNTKHYFWSPLKMGYASIILWYIFIYTHFSTTFQIDHHFHDFFLTKSTDSDGWVLPTEGAGYSWPIWA